MPGFLQVSTNDNKNYFINPAAIAYIYQSTKPDRCSVQFTSGDVQLDIALSAEVLVSKLQGMK